MLFPTVEFAIFFLVVFLLHWTTWDKHRFNKAMLLAASYVFYGWWDWRFVFLVAECSMANFMFALWIDGQEDARKRKLAVTLAVAFNLGVLAVFKYWGFFLSSVGDGLAVLGFARDLKIMEILLPAGVSFFTFQGISYVVDVYRRQATAVKDPVDLLLYLSFFPHLVAGPIVRAKEFLPQLAKAVDPASVHATRAFFLIVLGLFKKVVIAHYLAVELVNPVFEAPESYASFDVLLGIYGYAVQIYCDFSAYSDIAIGVALLFGFRFPQNFDQPYRASSLREFWHRWHMSLSSFLRDYLYIPLGGSRGGPVKTYRNLFLTMVLGGLWHGAAWNFVFWGVLHGGGLCLERLLGGLGVNIPEKGAGKVVRTALVFHLVCLTWIFFNASTFAAAWDFLAAFGNVGLPVRLATPFILALLAVGFAGQFLPKSLPEQLTAWWGRTPLPAQAAFVAVALVTIAALGPGALAPFIYFKF
jgi:D-alanyl-lipoteichoic acid acyltransferase DltB (MBOAT superfamily)